MKTIHYLEIVTPNPEATCALYGSLWDIRFGDPIADLGNLAPPKAPTAR